MAAVVLRNVTKVFGGKQDRVVAVDEASLQVDDRELVVLLGPSGCGKTTTLRLVAGLERLSGGDIEIGGRLVNDVGPKDRDVALVFQHYALYPHLNVYGNLAFGLKMRRTPKDEIERRIAEIARLLEIEHLLHRKPHSLSGGEQQRVALGRAIVRRPSVYLLDEPLANLDAQLRVQVRLELKRQQRELGMTVLYVTHDQHEALAIADRIVVMKDGRVQQCGRPQEVFERPANRFVAGFVGVPPMNFLEGRLVGAGDGVSFEYRGCRWPVPQDLSRRVSEWAGRRIVLGIRPERVRLRATDEKRPAIPVRVTMLVPLGDRLEVHTHMSDGGSIVARVPISTGLVDGGRVWVELDPDGMVLFDIGREGVNVATAGHGVAADAA